MRLFDRPDDSPLFRLAFEQGEKLGALRAELDAIKATVEVLKQQVPASDGVVPLDRSVVMTLQGLSRGDPALYRFLDAQARELLEAGVAPAKVIEQLKRGAPRPIPRESKEA